jgi:hypothetical protein
LLKVEEEDKMHYYKHVKVDSKLCVKAKIPPPPVVCLRTQNKIVVEPRNFQSIDESKLVSWYRVFACQMSDVNQKARISDYTYQGCGEQVSLLF